MNMMFTVTLNLEGKTILIVGGGKVAVRRIRKLLEHKAEIIVVSPHVDDEIHEWDKQGKIKVKKRCLEKKDLTHVFLVVVATNQLDALDIVEKEKSEHQLINMASAHTKGNVYIPASFSRGDLSVAVSTNGASPLLTKKLISELKVQFDDSYTQYTSFLKQCREIIHSMNLPHVEKYKLLTEATEEELRLSERSQEQFLKKLKNV
ncbi:precorrin-2 dehydrogenase [Priestia flexa]|uniref:precorrin-2 dehydrogenase n=1 Tax=Priestia flexa TaxID=86664 RepID=A0A8I1MHV7_9BACI|nr:NAD(P)-dependent oxidoreductase [Priestia flexa]MBN8253151.1 precorrin-2 dehydrogenase [Priestia flexa]MBN8433790.1 precorrin-2 dehydrogenase [Priestia flexa]MCA0965952.1 precorrin-2 dehydrogenase [Priestia flexa]RIV05929.1 precorrin-2 dehydrogenase [Priestia flexa]UIR29681.1 precorrin-2 dehydrogenase [Priestia flexa]